MIVENDLRQELATRIGIAISDDWWQQCIQAVQPLSFEMVLDQILHHDIRSVVRQSRNDGTTATPGVVLRQAIQQSKQSNSRYVAKLPLNEFKIMLQIEEVVDISVTSEARLQGDSAAVVAQGGGNNNNNGSGNYNRAPPKRCLRLLLSDGYYSTGLASSPNEQQRDNFIIALETEQIPNLLSQSMAMAGTKILVHSSNNVPVKIRHGSLLLNYGNTLVLGGNVPSLVNHARQALQQAQQRAGIGIDPTVRALIGTDNIGNDDDDNDENEGESNDVVQQPRVPAVVPVVQPEVFLAQPAVVPVQAIVQTPINRNIRTVVPLTQQQIDETIDLTESPQVLTPTMNPPTTIRRGGPTRLVGPFQTAASAVSAENNNANTSGTQQNAMPPPPHSASRYNPTPSNNDSSTVHVNGTANTENESLSPYRNPYMRSRPGTVAAAPSPAGTGLVLQPSVDNGISHLHLSGSTSQSILLSDWLQLYDQIRVDESLYRQNFGKTFIINLRLSKKLHFNIDKRKKNKTTSIPKKSKYEYVFIAQFQDPQYSSRSVTCKVSNEIVEPFFAKPPSEMRQLSRENRSLTDELVRQGGEKVFNSLSQVQSYHVTLLVPPEEFFSSQDTLSIIADGERAVVLLEKTT